jgi:hypothetical protein
MKSRRGQPRLLEDRPHGAVRVRDHPGHEPGRPHAADRGEGLGIGAGPQTHRRVVAAAPARDRLDLRLVGDGEVLEQVAQVAAVGDRALGGAGAGGQMRIEPHARPELRLLHLLEAGRAAPRPQMLGDDAVVHAQEGVARVERHATRTRG